MEKEHDRTNGRGRGRGRGEKGERLMIVKLYRPTVVRRGGIYRETEKIYITYQFHIMMQHEAIVGNRQNKPICILFIVWSLDHLPVTSTSRSAHLVMRLVLVLFLLSIQIPSDCLALSRVFTVLRPNCHSLDAMMAWRVDRRDQLQSTRHKKWWQKLVEGGREAAFGGRSEFAAGKNF